MRKEFLFADSYVPLNHGSYGTYPRSVRSEILKWSAVAEQRPDYFMRKTYMPEIVKGRTLVAEAIGAETQDCVFVMNATTGVHEVLRSLEWSAGDAVLLYSTVYGISLGVLMQGLVRKRCTISVTRSLGSLLSKSIWNIPSRTTRL